jgi:hypothetical protein
MLADPFRIAYFKGGRVNETDPCTRSITTLQICQQWEHHLWDERHKAGIAHQARKFAGQMNLDMFGVIGFEGTIVRLVKMDQDRHDAHLGTIARSFRAASLLQAVRLSSEEQMPAKNHRQHKTIRVDSLLDPSDG